MENKFICDFCKKEFIEKDEEAIFLGNEGCHMVCDSCSYKKHQPTECKISGCRNLQTTCVTCGRVICTKILPKVNEWIDINNREPEKNYQRILVCSTTKNMHVVNYFESGNSGTLWECDDGFEGEDISFTHWMPLPEVPK